MKQHMWIRLVITTACFLLIISSASAFEIGAWAQHPDEGKVDLTPSDIVGHPIFEKNHEKLTALALDCLAKFNNGKDSLELYPDKCENYGADTNKLSIFSKNANKSIVGKNEFRIPVELMRYRDLVSYVRWPDDPLRFIHDNPLAAGKFATLIKVGCQELKEKVERKNRPFYFSENGLFCVSHFGKLQFLHSMASEKGESAKQTRSLIDEWTEFAFELSISDELWDEKYCEYWKSRAKRSSVTSLSDIMMEENIEKNKWCDEPSNFRAIVNPVIEFFGGRPYADTYETWKVGITFNWRCKKVLQSRECSPYIKNENKIGKKESIQMSALGSVIHLIQDSYAKGHTERGSLTRVPEIVLNRVQSYRSYGNQDKDKHSESDKWPVVVPGDTLDPVTAVAQLVWLHHRYGSGKSTNGLSISNIIEKSFGKILETDEDAKAGELYLADG